MTRCIQTRNCVLVIFNESNRFLISGFTLVLVQLWIDLNTFFIIFIFLFCLYFIRQLECENLWIKDILYLNEIDTENLTSSFLVFWGLTFIKLKDPSKYGRGYFQDYSGKYWLIFRINPENSTLFSGLIWKMIRKITAYFPD